jgi:hypothetical protein
VRTKNNLSTRDADPPSNSTRLCTNRVDSRFMCTCNVRTFRLQVYDLVKVLRSPSAHFLLPSKGHLISIERPLDLHRKATWSPSESPLRRYPLPARLNVLPQYSNSFVRKRARNPTCSRNALIRIDNATQQQRQTSEPIFRECRPLRRI